VQDKDMANDLFVMLNNNKYNEVVERVEARVAALVAQRHEYPIWPLHEGEMDEFEKSYHGSIRGPYYLATIFMIQTLRSLRNIS
jgi:hypothetical protein